jgi:hypothetical protein
VGVDIVGVEWAVEFGLGNTILSIFDFSFWQQVDNNRKASGVDGD